MKVKVICDSSANLTRLDGVDFACAPLVISTDEKEYVDDESLNVLEMVEDLYTYKGKSRTACPGVGDWLEAFGDADIVYCVTIISTLSGSYNSAMTAKNQYEEENPGKKVFVLDSYSAGPETKMLVEKIRDLVLEGCSYEEVCQKVTEYKEKNTCLVFCLESLKNLANNGRCNPAVAKLSGLLGIRVIGDVSEEGQLHPVDKARGEKKAISSILSLMKKHGYAGKEVIIDHCFNSEAATKLKNLIKTEFENAKIRIEETRALCSFYAEKGGLMIAFEIH